jgi:hypothetical protein
MAMRTLFLTTFILCALSAAAEAQWATSRIEHDWRLTVGESSFGLVQTAVYMTDLEHVNHRVTTIHLGPFVTTTTRFRAPQIAAAVLLLLAAAGGAFVVHRASRGAKKP